MNKVFLMGRLTKDPEVYYSSDNTKAVVRYTLAVERRYHREGTEKETDFINCVAFGKPAEFAEKYLRQGMKILITGRIQTGNYVNKDGVKVYTTDIVVEEQEFAESKKASAAPENRPSATAGHQPAPGGYQAAPGGYQAAPAGYQAAPAGYQSAPAGYPSAPGNASDGGFMNIPDGIDEELPFN